MSDITPADDEERTARERAVTVAALTDDDGQQSTVADPEPYRTVRDAGGDDD